MPLTLDYAHCSLLQNREERLIVDFGCATAGLFSVAIYGERPTSETATVANDNHAVAAIIDLLTNGDH
jgi:long-subunit acyl-CoA synthetase (AMP-forming)